MPPLQGVHCLFELRAIFHFTCIHSKFSLGRNESMFKSKMQLHEVWPILFHSFLHIHIFQVFTKTCEIFAPGELFYNLDLCEIFQSKVVHKELFYILDTNNQCIFLEFISFLCLPMTHYKQNMVCLVFFYFLQHVVFFQ